MRQRLLDGWKWPLMVLKFRVPCTGDDSKAQCPVGVAKNNRRSFAPLRMTKPYFQGL